MTSKKTPRDSSVQNGRRSVSDRIMRRWTLAVLAGTAAAVAMSEYRPAAYLGSTIWTLASVGAGWFLGLAMCPWRDLGLVRTFTADLHQLMKRLRAVTRNDRKTPLSSIILDRNDDLGDLSHAIHEVVTASHASRLEARRRHRDVEHEVEKATTRATKALTKQAMTDPLTKLGNRRALELRLDEHFKPSRGAGRMIVIMAIDMDKFKQVNDSLGHDVGDECLVFLARVLIEHLRREDCPVRLGGDEFFVVMPGITVGAARAIAQRLSNEFARMPWKHTGAGRPTLSIGLAGAYSNRVNSADLMRRADEALYASKHGGRNQVTVYDEIAKAA